MIILTILTIKPQSPFYEQLLGNVDEKLLHLQDTRGTFLIDRVHETSLNYFIRNVIDKPWNNHLLLSILVYTEKNADVDTIRSLSYNLNSRLTDIFEIFHIKKMIDFDIEIHMYQYFKGFGISNSH